MISKEKDKKKTNKRKKPSSQLFSSWSLQGKLCHHLICLNITYNTFTWNTHTDTHSFIKTTYFAIHPHTNKAGCGWFVHRCPWQTNIKHNHCLSCLLGLYSVTFPLSPVRTQVSSSQNLAVKVNLSQRCKGVGNRWWNCHLRCQGCAILLYLDLTWQGRYAHIAGKIAFYHKKVHMVTLSRY